MIQNFFAKSGSASTLLFSISIILQSFEKIVRTVLEIWGVTRIIIIIIIIVIIFWAVGSTEVENCSLLQWHKYLNFRVSSMLTLIWQMTDWLIDSFPWSYKAIQASPGRIWSKWLSLIIHKFIILEQNILFEWSKITRKHSRSIWIITALIPWKLQGHTIESWKDMVQMTILDHP